jgi:PAS domain S-box-containing protein
MSRQPLTEDLSGSAMFLEPPVLPLELYREIFSHSNEAIAILDPQGRYLEQNLAHAGLLGYSDEDLRGKTPALHMGEETFIQVATQLQKEGEFRGEITSTSKSGQALHIQLSAFTLRDGAGETIGYVGIKRDITERKWMQQRLSLQYEITRILSESIDFVSSAREILQALGRNLGWQFGSVWRVDHGAQVLRSVDVWHEPKTVMIEFAQVCRNFLFEKGVGLPGRIWETGEAVWIADVLKDKNFPRSAFAGKVGLRAAFGFPILSGTEVLGIVEFFSPTIRQPDQDLLLLVSSIGRQIGQFTKRKRAEEEREDLLERERAARADSERANRLKDEFLATLSHELRTPLNAVIGWSRMLKSGRLDKESANHALQVIERNAWAQKQIIEDILDVSRVITGKLQLKTGPLDLVTVVDGALDAVRPALEAKEIQVETIIDAGLRMITGDADRLQQVIWNLLSNAAKFSPANGKVEIRVSQCGGNVQIQVSDTGPGIAPDFLPHVFERFRQADGSTTRTHGGLGLGLAIVRHLVELHGGVITAENRKEGTGAIFTLRLPLPTGELRPETLAIAASIFKDADAEPANLEGLRILIVDDENDALDLIAMELTQHGARVKPVSSAAEALATLEQREFDLLISDIGMPDIDGYDLIRRVRKSDSISTRRIPAVALTAYARVQDRMRAILAGYNTHVPKPVEASELVTIVASLAGRLGRG